MQTSYRESMDWLHTWSGLIVGWILFAVFVTGTLSYYVNEINLWMKPEFHKSQVSEQTVEIAVSKLIDEVSTSDEINVYLPDDRSNLVALRITKPHHKTMVTDTGRKYRVPYSYYDATTGELIPQTTKTAGGSFLYRFHFNLYSIPRNIARWIVGIATMSALIAIITGIIMHKRIFKDFFTFRARNNPRGWMDGHILPSIVALPYMIMIIYSSLLLFINLMMPWARQAYFDDGYQAYRQEMRKIYDNTAKNAKEYILEIPNNYYNKQQSNIINNPTISEKDLLTVITKAKQILNEDIGGFDIEKIKGKNGLKVTVSAKETQSIFRGEKRSVIFNTDTGFLIKREPALPSSSILQTNSAFRALHEVTFAEPTIRFLFFIAGILGTIIIGTGLILWIEKRKKKNLKNKSFGFWLVEKLNVGTIIGIFIAIGVFFIANRVLIVDEEVRRVTEINIFFTTWLLSYIHAALRETKKAWTEQLLLSAIIFMILPIINAITVFDNFTQIVNRDNIFIYFDIFFIFIAFVFLFVRRILLNKAKKGEEQ